MVMRLSDDQKDQSFKLGAGMGSEFLTRSYESWMSEVLSIS